MTTLDLRDLSAVSSVSPSVLVHCSEAAAVMMREFHTPPQTAGTWEHDGAAPQPIDMFWEEPGEQTLITHGNAKDATEYGGYAVAIALAGALGFRVVGRAFQGSGADWVMVPKGEPANDYYRLEASGMARPDSETPEHRLASKVEQLGRGDWQRPGLAVVVCFETPRVLSEARP